MTKWMLNNIPLKIGSVIIAMLLWFHVVTERVVYETVEAPFRFQNLPKNLVIVEASSNGVTFQIKTKIKQLILLNLFGHPFVKVDLSNAVRGKNKIKLSKDWIFLPSWRPLDITGLVSPKQLMIQTEKKDAKKVLVRVALKGKPREESYVKEITVEPDSIIIIGGKKRLRKIREIFTDTVDVSRKDKGFTIDSPLIMPEGGFSSQTDRVKVNIQFERYATKVLSGVRIILKGDENCEVYPATIDVTVRGPENLLSSLGASDIKAYIDVKGPQKNISPYFNLPEGIVFESSKPQKVDVRMKSKER